MNPPDAEPPIPEGFATKLGKYGAAAGIIVALLLQIFDINVDEDTKDILTGVLALAITTMIGRYAQATAERRDAPSPRQKAAENGEGDPEEDELLDTHPELESRLPADEPGAVPGLTGPTVGGE